MFESFSLNEYVQQHNQPEVLQIVVALKLRPEEPTFYTVFNVLWFSLINKQGATIHHKRLVDWAFMWKTSAFGLPNKFTEKVITGTQMFATDRMFNSSVLL